MFERRVAAVGAALTCLLVAGGGTTASAESPPPSWTNERVLDCDGETVVAYLTPAGFGSAFHVVDSTDIIKPKFVVVVIDGESVVTVDTPGFDRNGHDVVHCQYVDPAGLEVDFLGIRN